MSTSTSLCLVCNGSCVSSRNSVQIFNKEALTCSDVTLISAISKTLEKKLTESNVHSQLLCKKCYKLFDEVEELEHRLSEIKAELRNNYKNTLTKLLTEDPHQPSDGGENVSKIDSKKENEVPKKILDIPSSDEDTSHISADKGSLQTIEDIEMELVKIHGGINNEKELGNGVIEVEPTQTYCEFSISDTHELVDSGAVEHSSDSDYEPPTASSEIANPIVQKNTTENIQVKQEPCSEEGTNATTVLSEKPNILKRKIIAVNGGENMVLEERKADDLFGVTLVSKDGSLYTCQLCQGDETVAGEAKAIMFHMKTAHGARIYICDVCGHDFRKRNELSAHLDEHVAQEEGDFQCEVCNRIFSNLRLFRIHKRMHYPQNKAWTCETCGKKYSSKNLLDEHVNTHLGVRPYVCGLCGKDFASKYTFRAHEKTHEVRPRPFRCQQCPKSFLSQQNLTQHERTHSGLKEFACHLCGKQFGSAHNLEVHSIVHTGYKPFVCGMCNKAFARKAEIRDHERTHTGERPYQCEFCGATFSQRSNLQSHKRATHYDDKRYRCEECGKGFKRRRLLDYHVKAVHTGERPFKCDVCEATFVYPEHFKKHRRIHTGEKPFLCEVCGKAFNSRDNRNAHRFVHSDKKPYECLVCGAGFMRKPLLYQHMQSQGHLNDTIVVNQPRLTADGEESLVTVNAQGEMEIVNAAGDSKLYIADQDGAEHIIIDGQQITFADAGAATGSEDGNEAEVIDEIEQVVEDDYEEIITSDTLAGGETQIIETPDGPVHLVKVRIPNEEGEEEEAWIKIVPE